jgi:glycogen operon protein
VTTGPPGVPWAETIIYEAHVKGMTATRLDFPSNCAAPSPAWRIPRHRPSRQAWRHRTGVDADPRLLRRPHLVEHKLVNYWGYSTVNYFSLAPRYISYGGDLHEFKVLVRRLHEAGIEVLLDVVYNHTAEGNHLGPTLSFRGIDNASYYMLAEDRRFYFDTTGTGNTVNLCNPRVLQMVMDSLRYWVEECHVDGFRFDLASSLGRDYDHFDASAVFFDAVAQDPVLSRTKLIAEPWDLGPNGYQVGNFAPGWAEWNGRYRDDMRSFWKGDGALLPAFASRVLGSSDLFERRGRKTWASVNFITAHDGFTLTDLYSYNQKHNEKNGEGNRDGHDDNRSWNCGVEGATEDRAILDLRDRMRRNAMATLLLSQGTPMIVMGDEVGRTQGGNNNAYCQDNEISWLDWKDTNERDRAFHSFTRGLIQIRQGNNALRSERFLHGEMIDGNGTRNVVWYKPDGSEMNPPAWTDPLAKVVGLLLCDEEHRFLLLTNSYHQAIPFKLPALGLAGDWHVRVDTVTGEIDPAHRLVGLDQTYSLEGRSLVLLSGAAA